jgi:rSAM/selenodomain-associated transferase 1
MTPNLTNCRIIVFAKAPIPGKVKTRLLSSMDAQAAATLHEQLVLHSLDTAIQAKVGPVDLWCTPKVEHPFFNSCARKFQVHLHPQPEGDLGKKMSYAFDQTLKRAPMALLIGSDCPSLSGEDLKEAKTALQQGASAVISPAEDGGYVLIGLRQNEPKLFEGVDWGTASVMDQTRERFRELRWDWRELPERWDVDLPEDVERLKREGYGHLTPFKGEG